MPIKFKPSERVYRKDARGRRMSTDSQKCKMYKHFYIKDVPLDELMSTINSDRAKGRIAFLSVQIFLEFAREAFVTGVGY